MADEIIDLTQPNDLLEVVLTETIVDVQEVTDLIEVVTEEIIVETETTTEIIDATEESVILDVAMQGPPGPAGGSEAGPSLTYTSGVLTRVDYDSGNYKTLTYSSGVLTQIDYVKGATTTRRTLTYNPDGSLASVTEADL